MVMYKYALRLFAASMTLLATLIISLLAVAPASALPIVSSPALTRWNVQVGLQSKDDAIQAMIFLPHRLEINTGDTVSWTAASDDLHTVTFLAPNQAVPPFNMLDPQQTSKQGGSHYNGQTYYNSGLLSTFNPLHLAQIYSLTFDLPGSYTYLDLVHPTTRGIIHVRKAGTIYPYTPNQYHQQIKAESLRLLLRGRKLEVETAIRSNARTFMTDGAGDGVISLMRFYSPHLTVRVGDTVTFTNRDLLEPHTVTYGGNQAGGNFAPYGNPSAFDGTGPLNSGFIGINPHWFGMSFRVTFIKAGTYNFRCDLHGYMGMFATITVQK